LTEEKRNQDKEDREMKETKEMRDDMSEKMNEEKKDLLEDNIEKEKLDMVMIVTREESKDLLQPQLTKTSNISVANKELEEADITTAIIMIGEITETLMKEDLRKRMTVPDTNPSQLRLSLPDKKTEEIAAQKDPTDTAKMKTDLNTTNIMNLLSITYNIYL
jgi:hypothetical protein